MRQGGMKPKSHSSGTYWIRANARGGGGSSSTVEKGNSEMDLGAILGGISAIIFFIYLLIAFG